MERSRILTSVLAVTVTGSVLSDAKRIPAATASDFPRVSIVIFFSVRIHDSCVYFPFKNYHKLIVFITLETDNSILMIGFFIISA